MNIVLLIGNFIRGIVPPLRFIAKGIIALTYLIVGGQLLIIAFILEIIYGRNIYRKAYNLIRDTLRDILEK